MLHDSHAPVALFVPESFFKERWKGPDFSLVCRLRLNIFFDFIRHVEVRSRRYLSSSKITARDLNGENQKDLLKHNQLFGQSVCEKRCQRSSGVTSLCLVNIAQCLQDSSIYAIGVFVLDLEIQDLRPRFHQRRRYATCQRQELYIKQLSALDFINNCIESETQVVIGICIKIYRPRPFKPTQSYTQKNTISHAFLRLCPFGTSSIRIQNTLNIHLLTVSHSSQTNTLYDWRYLITFPSQGVADEWWRAIQDQVANKVPNWDHIKRITPQLYNYNPAIKWITQTVTDPTGVPQFFNRVFFTYLVGPTIASVGTVIPVQEITDHVSGQQ